MSSFSLFFRATAFAVALGTAGVLSGCTGLTPVYGDRDTSQRALPMSFATPNSELEQVVYQDLIRKFGTSDNPNAPQISVKVSVASRPAGQSATPDPALPQLLTATGFLQITRNGDKMLTTSRQATATYTANSQIIGDSTAYTGAAQQAAHALADTLELTILAALSPKPAQAQ
jgi:LPS-assembly lipoprotein